MAARPAAAPRRRPPLQARSGSVTRPARRPPQSGRLLRLPDGSRSVQSPWVWRAFLFLSLVALGLCISFVAGHHVVLAAAWGLITVGWFAISMWLWRRHVRDDDAWYAAHRGGRRATTG